MKKVLSAIVTTAMMFASCLGMTACKGGSSGEADISSSGDEFIVGAIYIGDRNEEAGYTYAHNKGIVTAVEELGLSVTDNLRIVDNVPEDDEQVASAIDQLVDEGCDIIFGITFGYIDAMSAKAEEYPDVVFSHASGYLSNDTNFNNYFGRIYQAFYLSGIAAGYKTLAQNNDNIGYVSAWGLEYAETCSGINAFTLGAQAVNPDVTVHVYQISAWNDPALERQAAQTLIDTYDCCVIAQDCDTAEPQIVASENGVYGCGYNSDMSEQAPASHLTAPVWNWEAYYRLAIETAMNNDASAFKGIVGNYSGDLFDGMIDIAPLTVNCTPETPEAIAIAKDLMESGEWDVFSGTALSFSGDVGIVSVEQTDRDLLTDSGVIIVNAGRGSINDSIIMGSMDYYVTGVVVEQGG